MGWVQLIAALLTFAIEFLRYLEKVNDKEEKLKPTEKAEKIIQLKAAMKEASKGNTDELENCFAMLRPSRIDK